MKHGSLQDRLDFAVAIAREAGQITLQYFRQEGLAVDRKSDDSPVTIADRRAEEHLRARIREGYPDDAILGEELGEVAGSSGYRWILDPIDGTKSFIHGVPLYGTLVAVEHGGEGALGVIMIPALDECVYAAKGLGAWYTRGSASPVRAQVSKCARLNEGLFLTSEVICFEQVGRQEAYSRLQAAARLTRTWGDCYGFMLVATGRAEVMIDAYLSLWDAAALQPILEEAGGSFTDWKGNPTIQSGEAVATNGAIRDEVLAITRQYEKKVAGFGVQGSG
ncbi:MAG: histidinol-phosphatase [Planctomycetaceae bacterium]|nr:histidinol-phosphatase [Planctomycetaceae bacterium]